MTHVERPETPRITPVPAAEWPEEVAPMLRAVGEMVGRDLNFFSTLARYPKLYKRFAVFGNHVRIRSSLPSRDRELLILRTCWLCRAEYDFTHHITVARALDFGEDEFERIKDGSDAPGWDKHTVALLRAAEELHADACVSGETWSTLAERYSTEQLMDVVFCVGQYVLVSMAVNSFGVQLEPWAHDHRVSRTLPRP